MTKPFSVHRSIFLAAAFMTCSTLAQGEAKQTAADPEAIAEFKSSLVGKYAHFDVVAYAEKIFFTEMRSLVITYGITEFFIDDNGELIARDSYCHASHKANLPFKSTVPDAFTRAIVPRLAVVQVKQDAGVFSLLRPETPTPIGIRLDDPQEKLPKNPKDPRISDDDHDGKPGVTVKLKLNNLFDTELYIARREIFSYELTPTENGVLRGVVKDRSEQLVVGSPLPLLRGQRSPLQVDDPQLNPMVLVPIDASYDCNRVMEERDQLLPAEPEVWE